MEVRGVLMVFRFVKSGFPSAFSSNRSVKTSKRFVISHFPSGFLHNCLGFPRFYSAFPHFRFGFSHFPLVISQERFRISGRCRTVITQKSA